MERAIKHPSQPEDEPAIICVGVGVSGLICQERPKTLLWCSYRSGSAPDLERLCENKAKDLDVFYQLSAEYSSMKVFIIGFQIFTP
jgi:hypothetical protein